ncbi:DUF6714 family protein [Cognatilysobacter xinjiangensis]|uniref:DUF6714 family protein n=1 Tax=Cognatilysobacter xinjiangensis TaxID=546892 RepID=UPI001E2FB646|nr:DUF6714 family protein [Lysobacter xinjiangensis]
MQSISRAFAAVPRPELSLRQFWLTDQKGMSGTITDEEWKVAAVARTDQNWSDLTAAEIVFYGCQLAHMGASEFCYYLPAYMSYSAQHTGEPLVGNEILGSVLFMLQPSKSHPSHSHEQYSGLSVAQRACISSFLEFVSKRGNEYEQGDAFRALRHWRQPPAVLAMFRKLFYGVMFSVALLPMSASATSCIFPQVTDETVSTAADVFVFRVLSTSINEQAPTERGHALARGNIRVVEKLRGHASYTAFEFSPHPGCGDRFVVGHYYMAFLPAGTGQFQASGANVLDLTTGYREGIDNVRWNPGFRAVSEAVAGKAPLSQLLPPQDRSPLEYSPAPPPPPEPSNHEEHGVLGLMNNCRCASIYPHSALNFVGSREACCAEVDKAVLTGLLRESLVPSAGEPYSPGLVQAYVCSLCAATWLLELPDRASGSWARVKASSRAVR